MTLAYSINLMFGIAFLRIQQLYANDAESCRTSRSITRAIDTRGGRSVCSLSSAERRNVV
jgi:hypothetical protein